MRSFNELQKSFNYSNIKFDPLVKKMTNLLMRNGNRSKAELILKKTFQCLESSYPGFSLHIFYLGVFEARRDIGVRAKPRNKKKKKKVAAFDTYTPYNISPLKGVSLGMRDIVKISKEGVASAPFWENLSGEILKCALGKGKAVSNRYKINELAKVNSRRVHFGVRQNLREKN